VNENAKERLDFKFVDGMRAVAAISVAVLHSSLYTGYEGDMARDYPAVAKLLFFGNYAVAIFIVLSGFVLMLPIARSRGLRLRRGTWTFLKRRAMRILPPYFASLLLFGILILLVPVMQTHRGTAWDSKIPATVDGALAHILLIHNLNKEWAYQINGPAWSIGTEWQLYFALPLLILPLWRRFGPVTALGASLVISAAVAIFMPQWDAGHLWFLGLFTMGALVANAVTRGVAPRGLGWIVLALGAAAGAWVFFASGPLWVNELLVGAAIAVGLMWMAVRHLGGRRTIIHRILECRPLVWIGLWSYSLYLIHSPLLGLGNLLMLDVEIPTIIRFAILTLVVLPLAGAIAYSFHLLVERRFITSHQKRVETPSAEGAERYAESRTIGTR
jgi:peptidoglycan/LPS O-acetylase OafA/YrhL